METRSVRIPAPPSIGYVGPVKRYVILTAYCLYALITGLIMYIANLALFIVESFGQLLWTLHNVPADVNANIGKTNSQIVAAMDAQDQDDDKMMEVEDKETPEDK